VHLLATVQALRLRERLIGLDEYFSETGSPLAIAIIKLFLNCLVVSLGFYLLMNVGQLIFSLADTAGPVTDPTIPKQSSAELIWVYFKTYAVWSFVPACCGVMIACAIERSDEARLRRLILGLVQGGIMAGIALLSLKLTSGSEAPFGYCVFTVVLYGGLGLILGYMLPAAIRRHWAALEKRLPDKVAVLRTSVLQYFRNIQQFQVWLNMRNEGLKGRRPIDVLAEESGLQLLTSFVAETRTKISPALA
jgi:hypothetical protein